MSILPDSRNLVLKIERSGKLEKEKKSWFL